MAIPPTLCVGIDLDDLRYYRGIHALPPAVETPVVFERAVPRFVDLCGRLGLRATLFTISSDLRWDEARESLAHAARAGHEIASHSRSHFYDLSRKERRRIEAEVAGSRDDLQDALGVPVVGFRGPGYNLSPTLLSVLAQTGFQYDASILPSPAYWAARAAIIGGMRLAGRRSASIPGRMRDFLRGRRPFVWGRVAPGLKEFPITACGPARLPLIGTTLTRASPMRDHLLWFARRLPFVHLEFHAIDFLDIAQDGLDPALAIEPALGVPLAARMDSYEHALKTLGAGRQNPVLAAM